MFRGGPLSQHELYPKKKKTKKPTKKPSNNKKPNMYVHMNGNIKARAGKAAASA